MNNLEPVNKRKMTKLFPISQYKLCYIDENKAYFTTQSLSKQTGDDWNDVPYEHNAGSPYEWHAEHDKETKPWSIASLYFEAGWLDRPNTMYQNSPYSVDMINKKQVPWLTIGDDNIYAGTKYLDFYDLIIKHGGKCWLDPAQEFSDYDNRRAK